MQSRSFRRFCITLIGLATLILANAEGLKAQNPESQLYSSVPQQLRARLLERLDLYVEYQRNKKYDKLYDLFYDEAIATAFKGQDKAEFVAVYKKGDDQNKSVRLLAFAANRVEKVDEDGTEVYKIYGDAKLHEQGEAAEKHMVIRAKFQKGDWYFSAPATVLEN
jgi:hypothetical protein